MSSHTQRQPYINEIQAEIAVIAEVAKIAEIQAFITQHATSNFKQLYFYKQQTRL